MKQKQEEKTKQDNDNVQKEHVKNEQNTAKENAKTVDTGKQGTNKDKSKQAGGK